MADNSKEVESFDVTEDSDGSAIVEVPDDFIDGDEGDQEAVSEARGGSVDDDADHPDDSEAVRAARRARRRAKKDLIRKTNVEKDVRLQQLQRENEEFRRQSEEMRRRLNNVERETQQNRISKVDQSIQDAQVRVEYAKMKLAEAANSNDGESLVEAQSLWRDAENQLSQLNRVKSDAQRQMNAPQQEVRLPDPSVQRNAAQWLNRNTWYRPDVSDKDSKIAKKVDELMVTQGWDPSSPDYWDELDNRLRNEIPHRYNDSSDGGQRERKPRNVVGSSGRESSAAYGGSNRSSFVLVPERVRAMKDAGIWDNPERKKKAIEYYRNFDRVNRSN